MTTSTRQNIIDALDARLRSILTSNSYHTDAGAHVFDWLDRDLADSELDAIIYRDTGCAHTQTSLTHYIHRLRVEIQLKTQNGDETASLLRAMLQDVYAAIDVDETFGGLAEMTEMIEDTMSIDQSDKITGSASIVIEIEYTTQKWTI